VAENTVARIGSGKPVNKSTLSLLKSPFETAGVEFVKNGVIVPPKKSGEA
jgi:hypothetical protein